MNSWQRPRTAARIELGICPDCSDGEAAPGGQRCARCRDTQNAHRRSRWASGASEGIRTRRKPIQRVTAALKRKERRSQGLCIQCAAPSKRFVLCGRCRTLAAATKRRYREKAKERHEPVHTVSD